MSYNEIKPVAWRYIGLDEDAGFTDDPKWAEAYPYSHAPLYDQSAIDRLTAERDDYAKAADFLELELAKFQIAADEARAERDAAVADAERYTWLRKHLVNWCPDYDKESLIWHAREALDAEIDAARAEGK